MGFTFKPFSIGPIHWEPKSIEPTETKDGMQTTFPIQMENVFGQSDTELGSFVSANVAYMLFAICNNVHSSISIIADEFSQIRPVLQDKKTNEYVLEHEALSLLETNDMRFNETQVKKELMVSFCAAGEAFPVIGGNVNYGPVSLYHYPANTVSTAQGMDGYIQTMYCTYHGISTTFNRALNTPVYKNMKTYVFEDQPKLNQLMHIISNTRRNYLRAQSDLEGVYYQALTKVYSGVHNYGILKNGSRPSGIWSPKEGGLNDEQYASFKEAVHNTYSGPTHAGKNLVTAVPITYQNLLLNPRDMDFINLINQSDVDVYNAFRIPLPLVTTETMTMANYSQAMYALYDLAILPKAKFLFKNIGDFVLARFKDGQRFRMVLDEREIPALKQRLIERGQSMRNIYAFTEDEIRATVGYPAKEEGGDVIYIPATYTEAGKEKEYIINPFMVEGHEPQATGTNEEPEDVVKPDDSEDNQDVIDKTGKTTKKRLKNE